MFYKLFAAESSTKQQKKKISKSKQQKEFVSGGDDKYKSSTDNEQKNTKKKTKYVNLYSQEGKDAQVVFLKGELCCIGEHVTGGNLILCPIFFINHKILT